MPAFDDRVSDARTIGAALVAKCQPTRLEMLRGDVRRERPDLPAPTDQQLNKVLDGTREIDIDAASAIVLDGRVRGRP